MNRKSCIKLSITTVFVIYIAALFEITVFRKGISMQNLLVKGSIEWVPFVGYFELIAKGNWYQFVYLFGGNIIWFVPFGTLVPLIIKRNISLLEIAIWGFLLSLVIETSQYIFGTGISEIDDLILNTVGVIVGFAVFRAIMKRKDG